MNDRLSKNKVIEILRSQHKIKTTLRTLNKLLPYMGLADKEKFSDSDVENIIKARGILDKYGNGDSGYLKVAEEFGVNPHTISLPKKPPSHSTNHNSSDSEEDDSKDSQKGDFARGVRKRVRAEFYNVYEQAVDEFINSDEPYEMLADVMDCKFQPWNQRMNVLEGRQMKHIQQEENPTTFDITAQEVDHILPEGNDRDINDADFHNQDDNGGLQ